MRRSEPSFFLTKNTGAPMGDLDGWMWPFARFSQCRWGETQSHAPNQPNQIHTTPNTELRRSRTKKPKADLLYLVQQATNTSSIFSNQTSSQSLSPKPSEPKLNKNPNP